MLTYVLYIYLPETFRLNLIS